MRLLAIGDIHGCLKQLNDLLSLVGPTAEDQVVLLGDYVDRGPDSRGVLNRILELKRQGMNLVCLRGNHEQMMFAARDNPDEYQDWTSEGGLQTLSSYGPSADVSDIPEEHWALLSDILVPYHETERHIFVHAGLDRDMPMSEQPSHLLYWEYLWDDMRHCSGKTVICGHSTQKSGNVKVVPGGVCIDTYAYGDGYLTCLDALSGKYWQVNRIGESRQGYIEFE